MPTQSKYIISVNGKPYYEVINENTDSIEIHRIGSPKESVYIFRSKIPKLIETLQEIHKNNPHKIEENS